MKASVSTVVSVFVLALSAAGCAGALGSSSSSQGSASASASIQVKAGFFFGHDLRDEESVVYVLDLSGSMGEESGTIVERAGTSLAANAAGGLTRGFLGKSAGSTVKSRIKRLNKKIEKVKLHLIASVNGLPDGAKFNIVLFSGGVIKLAPGMIRKSGASAALVSVFIDRLKEGGGTNMYAAVEAALYTPADHIILLTDGLPTSSTPDDIIDLVARHNEEGEMVVSTVGVGSDQAREFLAVLADENGGDYMMYE